MPSNPGSPAEYQPLYGAIQGQQTAIEHLQAMSASKHVPSALLFLGPHHVGKRSTALALTQALNCPQGPRTACGICPSCRKVTEGTHPDLIVVKPDGQFVRIDQIREIAQRLSLMPYEAKKRVVILTRAEAMNPQSANAFLKTLEEPPADTLLVLCAPSEGQLPDTIVSRCLPVRFQPLPFPIVETLLAAQAELSAEELSFCARFAQGCIRPELATKAGPWMILRDEVIQTIGRMDAASFAQVTEKSAKWGSGEDWKFVLAWLETWFRDLALLGSSGATSGAGMLGNQALQHLLVNADRMDQLMDWGRRFTPELALEGYRLVLATRQSLKLNASKPLAMEALWLQLRNALNSGSKVGRATGAA